MARVVYFDCFSGASGDMILGALIDAGVSFEALAGVVDSLALEGVGVTRRQVARSGIGATKLGVVTGAAGTDLPGTPAHTHDHTGKTGHHHHHHEEPHRGLADIAAIVERSALSESSKARATRLFRRLAEVEATIHQVPVEEVHLHEVGAIDSIVDIVGAVWALDSLAVDRVVASPLNVGSGTVQCAHGELPVPAPATARLLVDVPMYAAGPAVELLTPTGALLVTEYADEYGPVPAMRLARIGYGAGDRDLPGRPNVVRVLVGETTSPAEVEPVVVLECEIDDMNPQLYGVLMDRLLADGALDVFFTPIQMKKNRPGTLVTVIAPPSVRPALTDRLFRESTTLGIRVTETLRERLDRELVDVDCPFGPVRVKVARHGGTIVNAAPEFDDCVRIATASGRAVKDVHQAALQAWWARASRSS